MFQYTISQWVLFFFWYCFLGWIWESFYVSAVTAWKERKLKFVNRGFLHGPLIPIYGCAATLILFATLPVKSNLIAVYVFGMLAATCMELVTGTTMEAVFHVKYWDYSHIPLNYKGHICFFVSLFWGFFSVIMIRYIHAFSEKIVLGMSLTMVEGITFVLLVLFTYDFKVSLSEAIDMKELLETITESNETLRLLEGRFDAALAFGAKMEIEQLRERISGVRQEFKISITEKREEKLSVLHKAQELLEHVEEEYFADKSQLLEKIEKELRAIIQRRDKQFIYASRQLKRNPGVISKKYKEALDELRKLTNNLK